MAEWRWLDGGGDVDQNVKSATNIQNFLYIASFDTYKGSVKSVHMMSSRRWLNEDGWVGGGGGKKCQKSPK